MHHAHKHHGAEKVVKGETPHASADMNVTPLIDVLLVLLIIFMAALPLTQKGMDINLPLESTNQAPADNSQQIVLEYSADKSIAVNKQLVTLAKALAKAATEREIVRVGIRDEVRSRPAGDSLQHQREHAGDRNGLRRVERADQDRRREQRRIRPSR